MRCDRTLPACGNCVKRGEITFCSYIFQKAKARPKLQEYSESSDTTQGRIDQLEQLVLTLLENHRHAQTVVDPVSNGRDAEIDMTYANTSGDNCGSATHKDITLEHDRIPISLGTLNTSMKINATYKQHQSVDEAHWALLLNEVRNIKDLSLRFAEKGRLVKSGHIYIHSSDDMTNKRRR